MSWEARIARNKHMGTHLDGNVPFLFLFSCVDDVVVGVTKVALRQP